MSARKYSLVRILLWVVYPIGLFITITLMFLTCNDKILRTKQDVPGTEGIPVRKEFSMPTIPEGLSTVSQRADYLAEHYWDHFDFSDTGYIHLPEITEQVFVDYLDILPHTGRQNAESSITEMLAQTIDKDTTGMMYPYFLDLYKSYLHDPNSPMRNDEYYIPVTGFVLADTLSDMATKERAGFDLSMMKKNRVGQIATNFSYRLTSAKRGTLHKIQSDYILLLFYNPDCHSCSQTIDYLKQSELINSYLQEGSLKILAVYPDSDLAVWKKHLGDIPAAWINCYDKDQSVKNRLLYDLKAIPTLYLLDKDKMVLLKDMDVVTVEKYLSGLETESGIIKNKYR